MLSFAHKEAKVTPCLILIQESPENYGAIIFDAYLTKTAVKKYHIGLGQDYQKYSFYDPFTDRTENASNPIIQIDNLGLTALKCPTIYGGKWFHKIDLAQCQGQDALGIKGRTLSVFIEAKDKTVYNFFWMFLIFIESLKCKFEVHWPAYKDANNRRPTFSNSHVLPLRKLQPIDLV